MVFEEMPTPVDHVMCQVCGSDASVYLLDRQDGSEHQYCPVHEPRLPVGERQPRLVIQRWRLPPGNALSRQLAAPKESTEHQCLRSEMCDHGMLGGEGACRYYLSILTQSDQFAVWSDEFEDNVRRYVVENTCEEAAQLCVDFNSIQCLVGFFRITLERAEGRYASRRARKDDRAIELLLNHPEWTDEQIAEQVPTTVKQLQRWSNFTILRAVSNRTTNSDAS